MSTLDPLQLPGPPAQPLTPSPADLALASRASRAGLKISNGRTRARRAVAGPDATGIAIASPTTPASPRPDVTDTSRLLNRDLSWLEFNSRVLQLAQDPKTPLLERVRFLSIFSSNLDEFMMKRLGLLHRRIGDGIKAPELDGTNPVDLLDAMRITIRELQQQQSECFETSVRPALAAEGIHLADIESLTQEQRKWLRAWFRAYAFPVLTPLAVDQGHRFPFISNLSRSLGILLCEPGGCTTSGEEPLFARLKIPTVTNQWIRLPDEHGPGTGAASPKFGRGTFVSVADVIATCLDDLFPGMQIVEVVPFRVVRDSESPGEQADEDPDNLMEFVEEQLKARRFAKPVRMETGPSPSPRIIGHLSEELGLSGADIEERTGPLDYTSLVEIADLDRPELKWRKWTPVVPARLESKDQSIFDVIRAGEVLVHHPFESFEASATRFIQEAARDPDVLAIKQTIYRTSRESPFVTSLIRAAEQGKQVAVLVELRARFDEQANVKIANALEKAGAHVAYGVVGYKTHCKAAMVVRREAGALRTYVHLGTGNYHPRTAQLYTDLGLFTCEPTITDDATELFNFLTGRSRLDTYETLLVAPVNMKKRYLAMIQREIGFAQAHARGESAVGGRIIAKMNAFADNEVAEALYAASQAGVTITLFVRGFCCLRPGVAGLSENIRIVSVLGRFLEHSRIFHFGAGKADPLDGEWYIASADWMYRNLNNRVEAATPVHGRNARAKLLHILQVMNADRRGAWQLRADGRYDKLAPLPDLPAESPELLGTFETLMRAAAEPKR